MNVDNQLTLRNERDSEHQGSYLGRELENKFMISEVAPTDSKRRADGKPRENFS